MNAETIAVGTELLIGQIANTNAQYISNKLGEAGVNVYYHSVVGDNKGRVLEVLGLAVKRSDLIIITGGLGPTQDDMTKEAIAEFLESDLIMDEESEKRIKDYFKRINKEMTKNNLRQAMIPRGAIALQNDCGTAPGVFIKHGEKIIVLLPGPPNEMAPMFDAFVKNHLLKNQEIIFSKFIKVIGIPEAALEEKIMDLIEGQSNPTIAPYCGGGEVKLRVTAKASTKADAEKKVNPIVDEIIKRLGDSVYSTQGQSLEETVVELLKKTGKKLATAESCTGGMVSARITNIPGASEVFERGMVTYSNKAKVDLLGVDEKTLQQFGAVSHETARQMAEGARENTGADIAVGITGIAGPGGGTSEKPVGLVYIAVSDEKETESREFRFAGNREKIRLLSTVNAIDMIRRRIISNL